MYNDNNNNNNILQVFGGKPLKRTENFNFLEHLLLRFDGFLNVLGYNTVDYNINYTYIRTHDNMMCWFLHFIVNWTEGRGV